MCKVVATSTQILGAHAPLDRQDMEVCCTSAHTGTNPHISIQKDVQEEDAYGDLFSWSYELFVVV